MGVNCSVRLNEGACWDKVGEVGCALLGAKVRKEPLSGNMKNSYYAFVEGWSDRISPSVMVSSKLLGKDPPARYIACHTPEYIDILLDGDRNNPVALAIEDSDSLPYACWYGLESRSLYPKATAAKIALTEGLAKFFGGKGVYNDCSDDPMIFKSPFNFKGENDRSFYRYQDALLALKPLTQEDIDRCKKYASY